MAESNFDNINELRKLNQKFQLAMSVADEGYWEWNIPDKTLFFDRNSARIMNYSEEEILVGIDDMLQTVDNRDLEDFSKIMGIIIQGIEKQFEYSFRTVDYNSNPVWFKIVGKVFDTDEDGKPILVIGIMRDITRSKLEEKQILERDEKLRLLANYSTDVIIFYENFKKKFVSPSVYRVLGYTQEEYLEVDTINLLHPEDKHVVTYLFEKTKSHKETSEVVTYRQLHKKGYYMWIEAVANSRTINDGTIIITVNSRDITERKNALLAMEDSKRKLHDYIHNAPYGLFVSDNYGNYIDVNPAAEHLTGYSFDELIKMKISDIIPKEDNQKGMNHFLALQSSDKPVPLEIRFIRKSGEIRYWLVTAVKLSDNKFLAFTHDITDRKLTQNALEKSESQLRDIFENSTNMFYSHDANHKITYLSPQAEEILGYTQEEALVKWTNLVTDNPVNEIGYQNTVKALETGIKQPPYELEVLKKNGDTIWLEVREAPKVNKNGEVVIIGSATDITDRKKAEMELRESETLLNEVSKIAKVGGWEMDILHGGEAVWTKGTYDIVEIDYGEPVPGFEEHISFYLPEYRKYVTEKMNNLVTKYEKMEYEAQFLTQKGNLKWGRAKGRAVIKDGVCVKILGTFQDITAEKKAESELRESEAFLNEVSKIAKVGGWEMDMIKGGTADWTKGTYDILEMDYDDPVPSFEEHVNSYPPEYREYIIEGMNKLRSNYESILLEAPINSHKGNLKWIRVKGNPVFEGEVCVKLQGTFQDITAEMNAEKELRESEALLNEVSKIAKVGGWEIDLINDGKIIWTKGTYDIVELDYNEPVPEFSIHISWYLPEYREYVSEQMRKLVEEHEELFWEAPFITRNGNLKWGRAKGSVVLIDGVCVKLRGTYQDITAEKKAEEKLQSERERLAVTLRSIGDGVITTDTHGKITLMNKVAEELTGWTHEEAIDQPLESILNLVHEHTYEKHPNPIERVLKTGAIVELQNHTILISKDGKERMIADSGAPIRDKYSKIIGVVLVFRDITEKHKLEQAIQKATKLESLGVLAAGIAHDFNNLLGGVFGYIDIARTFTDNPQLIEYLDSSMEALDRARALTGQLLTFSKGGEPITSVTSLFPFVKDTVEFILSGSNIKCKYYIDPELWSCDIDKNQIGQVVDNIVINAREAMSDRGKIIVSAQNREIENDAIPNLSSGKYVQLIFKDFGKGIPKEIIGKVFDPFFTTKNLGNGLGLATCYSIIEKHDGIIEIDSEDGEGTEVRIFIPAYARKINGKNGYMKKIHKGEGKILILDDELIIRKMLTTMLSSFGYEVKSKEEGSEALFYYKREIEKGTVFKALIFDLTIQGGLGGRDIIRDIREIDPDIPIFVASGYSGDPIIANPTNYGFTASIVKPFKINELATVLDKHLNN